MVFRRPRIEHGVAGRRRLDLERFQLLHEAVAQRQVVGDDDLFGFEAVREIAEQDVFRDIVVSAFARCCLPCRYCDRDVFDLLLDDEVGIRATEVYCERGIFSIEFAPKTQQRLRQVELLLLGPIFCCECPLCFVGEVT